MEIHKWTIETWNHGIHFVFFFTVNIYFLFHWFSIFLWFFTSNFHFSFPVSSGFFYFFLSSCLLLQLFSLSFHLIFLSPFSSASLFSPIPLLLFLFPFLVFLHFHPPPPPCIISLSHFFFPFFSTPIFIPLCCPSFIFLIRTHVLCSQLTKVIFFPFSPFSFSFLQSLFIFSSFSIL